MRGLVSSRSFPGVLVLLAIAFVGSVARADNSAESPESAGAPAPAAPAISVEAVTAREVREARQSVEGAITQMRATSLRVRDQLRITRRRGSAQQVGCVDQALSRSDASVRRARELGDDVLAAYARGDATSARAQMHRLGELRVAQRLASADANACTPGAVVVPSGTTVKLEIDPQIPRAL